MNRFILGSLLILLVFSRESLGALGPADRCSLVLDAAGRRLDTGLVYFLEGYIEGELAKVRAIVGPEHFAHAFQVLNVKGIKYSKSEISFTNGTGYAILVHVDRKTTASLLLKVIPEIILDSAELIDFKTFATINRGFHILSAQGYLPRELAEDLTRNLPHRVYDDSPLKEKIILRLRPSDNGDSSGLPLKDLMDELLKKEILILRPILGLRGDAHFDVELKTRQDVNRLLGLVWAREIEKPNISSKAQ